MIKERSRYSVVLGCGSNGLEWAERQKPKIVVGLDHNHIDNQSSRYVCGEVFNLPFPKNSVSIIYADFVLNAISVGDIAYKDIISNPRILAEEGIPKILSEWFTNTLRGDEDKVKGNIEQLRWILRRQALREMWTALANKGEIIVVEKPHVVRWITREASHFLPDGMTMRFQQINFDDMERSESLRKVLERNESPQKLSLKKFL